MDKNLLSVLDEVLNYMLNAHNPPFRTFTEIQENFSWASTKEINTDSKFLEEILLKLERDYFITTEIRESDNIKTYRSTFDGRVFMQNPGGYINKYTNDGIMRQEILNEKQIIKDERALRKKNDRRLIVGTFLVAVGAIGLIIWEMYKTYHIEHHCFP